MEFQASTSTEHFFLERRWDGGRREGGQRRKMLMALGLLVGAAAFFAAGIAAKRNGWLDGLANLSSRSLWALRSLVLLFAALIVFPRWQELLEPSMNQGSSVAHKTRFLLILYSWSLVQCFFGVSVSVVVIDLFRRCFNHGGGFIHRFFTESMYGAFLFHYPLAHFFVWTYIHLVLEQHLGKELIFHANPWCFLHLKCDKGLNTATITSTTPIEEGYLWLGWAYTTVLTVLVVFPISYCLGKLPVLREIL